MASKVTAVLLACLLVVSSIAAVATIGTGAAAQDSSSACNQTAIHDFTTASSIEEFNQSDRATSTVRNTDVELEDATGFIRVHSENPNGYCVAITVEISSEIVPAADLGTVESNAEHVEAKWRAIQNLSSGEVYTEISFTLPAGGNASFAPSKVRVQSLSWTGEAKDRGGSIVSAVTGFLSESSLLEKRKYDIEPANGSSSVTVPLEHDGERVDEWIATYRVDDGPSRDVTQDASAPVYYTEGESAVTFHFNQRDAEVKFTAEPKMTEKFTHSARSYWSGVTDLSDWIPGGD